MTLSQIKVKGEPSPMRTKIFLKVTVSGKSLTKEDEVKVRLLNNLLLFVL